ncbi:hypothetical protein LJR220_001662 [Bradyrhizobium sp. LjRoot220]|uniref:hypothetical protein n=1 Tax=Bradyrhizobium sp. LjRoot220 TaxID=3342284 RepID=UPI003ECFBED4
MRTAAALAASRPDPPETDAATISHSPEYAVALERWRGKRAEMRALNSRKEDLTVAIHLASVPRPFPERVKPLSEKHAELLRQIERNPRRVQMELEDVTDKILESQPEYSAEHELLEQAKRLEAGRIAALFRGRHVTAVRSLISAVEQLSQAIESERAVRREFARVSPEPVSAALFDWSSDLRGMSLLEWHSVAATWARRIRQSDILK